MAASLESKIKIWDVRTGKCMRQFTGHKNEKYCIAVDFTYNNRWVVSGSEDRMIYLWDLQTKDVVQQLNGHVDVVLAIACHPKQQLIASGALENDRLIKGWVNEN
ncbi:WD repeat-containing protein 5B [Trichinella pseudospiralis]|nr:WD repeat-containing protein 5B [Trichinella pseudospiralis]